MWRVEIIGGGDGTTSALCLSHATEKKEFDRQFLSKKKKSDDKNKNPSSSVRRAVLKAKVKDDYRSRHIGNNNAEKVRLFYRILGVYELRRIVNVPQS